MALPSWVSEIETKPAPLPLLLVQAFVNTYEADTDTDLLVDPRPARGGCAAADYWTPPNSTPRNCRSSATYVRR